MVIGGQPIGSTDLWGLLNGVPSIDPNGVISYGFLNHLSTGTSGEGLRLKGIRIKLVKTE